jgi:chromosome segregation ATPase
MVAHMVIRADAVEVELSLVEGPVAPWSARCEELRWAEVAARNDAGLWKSRFETSRKHLTAAVEEMKAVRRAAKDALFLQAEVARLTKLLSDAGVEPGKRRARVSLSQAVRELKQQQNTIKSLSRENTRLRKGAKASQNRIETLEARLARLRATRRSLSKTVSGTDAELRRVLRRSRCQKTALKSLSRENTRLRKGAKASQNRIETLEARLARLRATRRSRRRRCPAPTLSCAGS